MFSRTEKRIIKHFSNPNPSTRIRDVAECCGISEMYAYQTIRRLELRGALEITRNKRVQGGRGYRKIAVRPDAKAV